LNILLSGKVFDSNIISPGSIISNKRHSFIHDKNTLLSIENNYFKQSKKVINSKEQLIDLLNKKQFTNIGLTCGCFDILHKGHINNFKLCKGKSDVLLVCLSSDKQIREIKGEYRPINNLEDRVKLLSEISYIDYIILYDEIDNYTEKELDNIINIVNPDYWFKGSDYKEKEIRMKHPSIKNIILFDNIENVSTTKIIEKIKS